MDLLAKLQRSIEWAQSAEFYRHMLENTGCKRDISSFDDFLKVPIMTAEDIRNNAHEFNFIPKSERYSLYATGGTTGKPKLIYYTEEALESVAHATSDGLQKIFPDLKGELSILIVPADNLAAVGEYTKRALRNLGSYSGSMGLTYTPVQSAQLARVMQEGRPKLIIGNPARLTKLVMELKDCGVDPRSVGLSYILSTSEVLTAKARAMLEDEFSATVFQGGGMSEVGWSSMEDRDRDGQCILENVYAEVLNESGSITNGVGELYLTSLVNPAFPLVRYKTEDLVRVNDGKIWYLCRNSEKVIIDSKPVYAFQIDEALELVPEVNAAFSCITHDSKVLLKVESVNQSPEVCASIQNALKEILPNVEVELVTPESLERSPRGKVKDRMIQKV